MRPCLKTNNRRIKRKSKRKKRRERGRRGKVKGEGGSNYMNLWVLPWEAHAICVCKKVNQDSVDLV